MEREIYRKVIYFDDYSEEKDFKTAVQQEFDKVKAKYPNCFITKDFINQKDIVVRAIEITARTQKLQEQDRDKNRDRSDGFRSSYDRERSR